MRQIFKSCYVYVGICFRNHILLVTLTELETVWSSRVEEAKICCCSLQLVFRVRCKGIAGHDGLIWLISCKAFSRSIYAQEKVGWKNLQKHLSRVGKGG